MSNIGQFRWGQLFSELAQHCPILLTCVEAAATIRPHKASGGGRREERVDNAIVGIFASMVGAAHKPSMQLTQNIIGLILWLGSCKREVWITLCDLYKNTT